MNKRVATQRGEEHHEKEKERYCEKERKTMSRGEESITRKKKGINKKK